MYLEQAPFQFCLLEACLVLWRRLQSQVVISVISSLLDSRKWKAVYVFRDSLIVEIGPIEIVRVWFSWEFAWRSCEQQCWGSVYERRSPFNFVAVLQHALAAGGSESRSPFFIVPLTWGMLGGRPRLISQTFFIFWGSQMMAIKLARLSGRGGSSFQLRKVLALYSTSAVITPATAAPTSAKAG